MKIVPIRSAGKWIRHSSRGLIVARLRGRLRGLRDQWRAGTATRAEVDARLSTWIAHTSHADTVRIRQAIFAGGRFEPWPGE